MNGSFREIRVFLDCIECSTELVLCLPFVFLNYLLSSLQKKDADLLMVGKKSCIKIGAQDCSPFINGSYTGDISASMLKELGCEYVILGHSERRKYHSETSALVGQKSVMAALCGIVPIVCIGETEIKNKKKEIVEQLSFFHHEKKADFFSNKGKGANIIIAYEPVYAVGALKPPNNKEIQESIEIIKHEITYEGSDNIRILYGGAVDEDNAENILSINGIDGLLIGRASLDYKKLNYILNISKINNKLCNIKQR